MEAKEYRRIEQGILVEQRHPEITGETWKMGNEDGLGVTTGQPNLYKQDLSKLVSSRSDAVVFAPFI